MTAPSATADSVGELLHAVENAVNIRHDVASVDLDDGVLGCTQRGVQHGAIFGEVDRLAREHGLHVLGHGALAGEGEERVHGGGVHQIFRVVEVNAEGVEGELGAAGAILGEGAAQVHLLAALRERGQFLPRLGAIGLDMPSGHDGRGGLGGGGCNLGRRRGA